MESVKSKKACLEFTEIISVQFFSLPYLEKKNRKITLRDILLISVCPPSLCLPGHRRDSHGVADRLLLHLQYHSGGEQCADTAACCLLVAGQGYFNRYFINHNSYGNYESHSFVLNPLSASGPIYRPKACFKFTFNWKLKYASCNMLFHFRLK